MRQFMLAIFLLIIFGENYCLSSGSRETRNNYCSKIVREIEEVVVPESKTVKESYKAFCWSITLSCIRHRYKTVYVNKTLTVPKTKRVLDCCAGYEKKNDSCIPMCKFGCGHGKCVEPDICLCDPGLMEPLCIIECEPNRFGRGCKGNCTCLNGGDCDPETGYCYCADGYIGVSCELPCPENTYGEDCAKECECENDAICDIVDGTCYCKPGYEGEYCEKPCKNGTHGEDCNKLCICIPENTHSCNHVNGKCKCKPGFKGEACEKECDNMTYGPECRKECHCVHGEYCDPISGECICKPGWTGTKCSKKCPIGTFGEDCNFRCFHCVNESSYCDHITGDCICFPGYYGITCDKECLPGYWGSNCTNICSCNDNELCDGKNGECYLQMNNNTSKTIECLPGFWGPNCTNICFCKVNELCDVKSGKCYLRTKNAIVTTVAYFQYSLKYIYIFLGGVLLLGAIFAVMCFFHKTSTYKPFNRFPFSLYNLISRVMSRKMCKPDLTINNPVYENPQVILETDEHEKDYIRGSYSSGMKYFKNNNYEATTEIKQSNVEKSEDLPEDFVKNKKEKENSDLRKSKILSDISATFKEMKRSSMRKSDSIHASTNQLDEDFQPEVLDDFNVIENIYEKSIEERNENIYDIPYLKDKNQLGEKKDEAN